MSCGWGACLGLVLRTGLPLTRQPGKWFLSSTDLFGTYAGRAADYEAWLDDAQINRDRNLRLQYLAGHGLNAYHAGTIFADMRAFGRPPPVGLFVGQPSLLDALARSVQVTLARKEAPGIDARP